MLAKVGLRDRVKNTPDMLIQPVLKNIKSGSNFADKVRACFFSFSPGG